MVAPDVVALLSNTFGEEETGFIVALAGAQASLEGSLVLRVREQIRREARRVVALSREHGELVTEGVDFTNVVMGNTYEAILSGINSTKRPVRLPAVTLAVPPPGKVPRSLAELRVWWDRYRKMGKVPLRQQSMANKIRREFLRQIQDAWRQASTPFLTGEVAEQSAAVAHIMERAEVSFARAKMITETETTYYYNKTRRDIYDASDDVAAYLFAAIRDHRTTPWCKTRHGLVYLKDDPLLELETPPIHWNCRSEVLPLVRHNEAHLKLIVSLAHARRRHICAPLPPEWTGANRLR